MADRKKKIDVVVDFSYDSENPEYNREYRQWRRTNKAPYMYRYTGNPDEISYVDGNAVSVPNAALTERQALTHCATLLGFALLIYLVAELIGGSAMAGILHALGFRVRYDYLNLTVHGAQWPVIIVRAFKKTLKYLFPLILLARMGRLPRGVMVSFNVRAVPETIAAVGAAMCVAGVYTLTAQTGGVSLTQEIFSYQSRSGVTLYGLFDVFVISILAELLFRGAMLPILRQYGDGFAIGLTSAAAFLLPNSLPDRIVEFLVGLCAGYLMLRSGSVVKCVLLRSLCTLLCYARIILIYANSTIPLWQYAMLLLSCGALICMVFVRIRKERIHLNNGETRLSDGKKLAVILQCLPILPWTGITVLLMLFQVFL